MNGSVKVSLLWQACLVFFRRLLDLDGGGEGFNGAAGRSSRPLHPHISDAQASLALESGSLSLSWGSLPVFWLTLAGLLLAGIAAWLAFWYPRKSVRLAEKQIEQESHAAVHAKAFPHATLRAAIELTNTGRSAVVVKAVRITRMPGGEAPIETFPLDLVLLPSQPQLVGIWREIRMYCKKHPPFSLERIAQDANRWAFRFAMIR